MKRLETVEKTCENCGWVRFLKLGLKCKNIHSDYFDEMVQFNSSCNRWN